MGVKQKLKYYLAGFGLFFCLSLNAFAATPPSPPQEKNEKKVDIQQNDVVQFLQTLEIFGRVEKPQTVFIIPGRDPKVDDIMVKREFFKEIFRVVEKPTIDSKKVKMKDIPYIPY